MSAGDEPRLAASVILARQADNAVEVFLVRRPPAATAFADVWVFPGGVVQARDYEGAPAGGLAGRGGIQPPTEGDAAAIVRAAVRELAEEAGVVVARADLTCFSHWITPPTSPRRFDTRFYVAALPEGQSAAHCGVETIDGRWMSAVDALAHHARGDLPLVMPTRLNLLRLAHHQSLDALMDDARAKPIRTVLIGDPSTAGDPRYWQESPEALGW